ncbi:hypothetical protein [Kribbella catacumbae]|uniref:hypothetical protein n=1 Tax=Kribbella catacumbae TaxID=460086 RepID=UPI0003A51C0C|nr:hypothetical protein [Kribbella catacumbae]
MLTGSGQADTLLGLGGQDKLNGMAGDDLVDGGLDGDTLSGGSGSGIDTVNYAGYREAVTVRLDGGVSPAVPLARATSWAPMWRTSLGEPVATGCSGAIC